MVFTLYIYKFYYTSVRGVQKLLSQPEGRSERDIGYSFQLAITAARKILIAYGTATAQSWLLDGKCGLSTYTLVTKISSKETTNRWWLNNLVTSLWPSQVSFGPASFPTRSNEERVCHILTMTCMIRRQINDKQSNYWAVIDSIFNQLHISVRDKHLIIYQIRPFFDINRYSLFQYTYTITNQNKPQRWKRINDSTLWKDDFFYAASK